jgi:hypothetical protein
MKEQHKSKALDGLDSDSSASDGVAGHLQEIVGKGTESGPWSWHSGVPYLPGFLEGLTSFYRESVETTTLFVKRTTKERVGNHLPDSRTPGGRSYGTP